MPSKELKFGKESRDSILKGINTVADAVKVTLGPMGNCVILCDNERIPKVTKDGVSVAKEVILKDPFENAGARLVREAAEKTLNTVGDATTTSTVLAQSIVNLGAEALDRGSNPVKLKRGLELGCQKAIDYIESHTITLKDNDIRNIATISANNDAELGIMIADAFSKIGRDGVVTVEESSNVNTTTEVITGMQLERGYLSQHFVTNIEKDECILENPYILITEQKINNLRDLSFILNQIASEQRSLLLIAEDFDSSVLETLKLNKLQGILKVCAIKSPSFGEYRKSILEDIAVLTSGTSITYESGLDIKDISMKYLGQCKKAIINKNSTTIVGEHTSNDMVVNHVNCLKAELDRIRKDSTLDNSFMTTFLQERIAKLTGGIACIYVGGTTELEMHERKDRVDDAVSATKAAIEEGVVLGGGLTYWNASNELSEVFAKEHFEKDVCIGIDIIIKSLKAPLIQLISNAGLSITKIEPNLSETIGYDLYSEKYVDMYKSGIIDPAKAAKLALKNSVSVGCIFLSTECVIVPEQMTQFIL